MVEHRLVQPQGGNYLFTHALVLEGVLGSLLRTEREALHLKAAEWFEERDITLRTMHLGRADDPRAAVAFADAAEQQLGTYRFGTAQDIATRGLDAAPSDANAARLHVLAGEARMGVGNASGAIADFERAVQLKPSDAQLCRALLRLGRAYRIQGRRDDALATLERAEPIAHATMRPDALVEVGRYTRCSWAVCRGRDCL